MQPLVAKARKGAASSDQENARPAITVSKKSSSSDSDVMVTPVRASVRVLEDIAVELKAAEKAKQPNNKKAESRPRRALGNIPTTRATTRNSSATTRNRRVTRSNKGKGPR